MQAALPIYRLLFTVFTKQYIPALFLNILLSEITVSLLFKLWKTFIGTGVDKLSNDWEEEKDL